MAPAYRRGHDPAGHPPAAHGSGIRRDENRDEGDLYVSGSGTLVHALLADGLVDELHLLVYPLTRGSGPRLFPEGAEPATLTLAGARSFENGVGYLNYRPLA